MMRRMFLCTLMLLLASWSLTACQQASGQTGKSEQAGQSGQPDQAGQSGQENQPGQPDQAGQSKSPEAGSGDSGVSKSPTAASLTETSTGPSGKASDSDNLPRIQVTWDEGKQEIPSAAGSIEWMSKDEKTGEAQGIAACGADPLPYLAKEEQDLPYLPLESLITIEFLNTPAPDSVTLSDIILKEDGTAKYQPETVETAELKTEGQKVSFNLNTNFWAMLSSDMSVYQKGGVIRGFRLDCSWENGSSADYGFVLRTDAACGAEDHSAEVYPMSMCGTGVSVFSVIDHIENRDGNITLKVTLNNQTDQDIRSLSTLRQESGRKSP